MMATAETDHPPETARGGAAPQERLSDILRAIAGDESRERIAVRDLLAIMKDRALGALLFIFALPNVLPTPPGTSAVLGAPLIFLAAQLALGRPPWLPGFIAHRSIARADFAALVARTNPWLAKAERLLRPRLGVLARPPAEYLVGLFCFVLAVILFLPIPLGNMMPALAICLFSLGILERDGVWILAGLLTMILSIGLVWGVLYALIKSALFIMAHAFD